MNTTIHISISQPSQKLLDYIETMKEVKKEQLQELRRKVNYTQVISL